MTRLLFALIALLSPGLALASDAHIIASTHEVSITLHDAVATAHVERIFTTTHPHPLELTAELSLPERAIASQLHRYLDGRWHPAQLLPPEDAHTQYTHTLGRDTHPGPYLSPTSIATLSYEDGDHSLRAYPIEPTRPAMLRYQWRSAMSRMAGQRILTLPCDHKHPRTRLTLHSTSPGALHVNGRKVSPGVPFTPTCSRGSILLTQDAPNASAHHWRAGTHGTLHLELPKTLSSLPEHLDLVFVLDASRSIDADTWNHQIEQVRRVSRLVPDTRVHIIDVHHKATAWTPDWIRPEHLEWHLSTRQVPRHNGSMLQNGIDLAASLLKAQPRTGRERIVIAMTDGLFHRTWRPLPSLPTLRARLHIYHLDRRNHTWLPPSQRNAFFRAAVMTHGESRLASAWQPEALLRPTRLTHLELQGHDAPLPTWLHEGSGAWWKTTTSGEVTLAGRLWDRRVTYTFQARNLPEPTRAATILSAHHERNHPALERMAQAIGPFSSAIAIPQNATPNRTQPLLARRRHHVTCGGGRPHPYYANSPPVRPYDDALHAMVLRCVGARSKDAWHMNIDMLMTFEEVAHLKIKGLDPSHRTCLRDKILAYDWSSAIAQEPYHPIQATYWQFHDDELHSILKFGHCQGTGPQHCITFERARKLPRPKRPQPSRSPALLPHIGAPDITP